MELFKITCVTCQAKLSVRNEGLIGQIVACPRCESMVQIERPLAAAAVPVAIESVAPPEPIPQPAPIPEPVAELPAAEAVPTPPEAPPVSTSVAKYKLLGWALGAFVAGAAVSGAVIFMRGDSSGDAEPSATVVQQQETAKVQESSEKSATEVADVTQNPDDKITDQPQVEPEETVVDPAIEEGDVSAVVAKPQSEEVTPTDKAEDIAEPESVGDVPKVARKFDPLDFDPENLDLATINSAGVEEASKPKTEEPDKTEPGQNNEAVQESPPSTLPSTLPSVRRDQEQTVTPTVAEEKLKQRFPALKVEKIPLGDFLTLISRLAAVPVSVAPEELQMAGITARKVVSLDAKEVDLNEALRLALKPLHLEHLVEGPLVRVVRKDGSRLREVDYPLDDLSTVASVETIATWIEQLVAPSEWQAVGGSGTMQKSDGSLKVKQKQRVQYQVLIFLERLRLANKLPPRSRFPIKRFSSTPAYAALASRLEAPTVFTFSRYTALQEIVRHWQREIGIPVLVDWPALAEVDLWPQTRVACAIDNKPWRVALSEVLEPLGMGWRATAGGMLEITTSQKVQTQPLLELYSLSKAPDSGADRMLAELTSLAKTQLPNAATVEPTAVVFDSNTNVVFVLQSAAVQRKAYQWLMQKRLLPIE